MYKPVGMALGAVAGIAAGAIFRRVWRLTGEDEAPSPTDVDRGWGEVLLAAAVEGAIFAAVRAAVSRGGAASVRRITGEWPD
jgi:hypothetical protein